MPIPPGLAVPSPLPCVCCSFQTVGYIPAVYGLRMPDWYFSWINFLDIFQSKCAQVTNPCVRISHGEARFLIVYPVFAQLIGLESFTQEAAWKQAFVGS